MSLAPKAEARKAGSNNNDADETSRPPISAGRAAEYSKYRRSSRYTLRKDRRARVCHISL